jgi:hypothetical protein
MSFPWHFGRGGELTPFEACGGFGFFAAGRGCAELVVGAVVAADQGEGAGAAAGGADGAEGAAALISSEAP